MRGRKLRLVGDHSSYHSGCAAVWEVLVDWSRKQGMVLTTGSDFEVLVVNGEGSMHHGRPTFLKKMNELRDAVASNKPAFLVNSVWQENPSEYDAVLAGLSGVYVREALSAAELRKKHNIVSKRALDLSFFADVATTDEVVDYAGKIVKTDFLSADAGDFAPFQHVELAGLPEFRLKDHPWAKSVTSLRTASLLVTGRHHAVYAACKARVPFAAIEGNSHKIKGLIVSAGLEIPIARREGDIIDVIQWAKANRESYIRLFDWMEEEAARGVGDFALPLLS